MNQKPLVREAFLLISMRTLLLSFFTLLALTSFGQENWCGTDQRINAEIDKDPNVRQILYNGLHQAANTRSDFAEGNRATLQIPVVVHVLHDNGLGNISDAQIYDALFILNQDYNRLNPDTVDTRDEVLAPFKQYAASMDVEFKLAKIDPQGNCTNGILRINAPTQTYNASDDCKFTANGGSDAWPRDSYFNIWVVNNIESGGSGITLGYAQFPYFGSGDTYGIVIRHDSFGTIGTAQGTDGRTLTHEVGHCFGLPHIFDEGWGTPGCSTGDCANSGDMSCDTPPQSAANWSCNPTWNSCTDIPANDPYGADVYDQIENYMSYNSCQNMFSMDQANIMSNNLSTVPFLMGLVSASNITATGVNDPDVLCKADFTASQTEICPGTVVTFSDYTYHGPTSWTWTVSPGTEGVDYMFVGGTDATSQNPEIEFLSGGYYDISLTATDGVTSDSETKTGYIQVLPTANTLPFIERFEDYSSLSATEQWTVFNPGNNNTFEIFTGFGHTGNQCIGINNFAESGSNTDEVVAAPVDLSVVDTSLNEIVTMTFRYAYRKKNSANDEWLKVFISQDCGASWAQRKTIHGSLLSSLVETSSWQPAGQEDWTTVHMTNITAAYFVDNFLYKFEFEGSGGNNFYLDDINIYKGAPSDNIVGGVSDDESIADFGVYPNPTTDQLTVRFSVGSASDMEIFVRDITGKIVQSQFVKASTGTNLVLMDLGAFANGAYLVEIKSGNTKRIERVIKK